MSSFSSAKALRGHFDESVLFAENVTNSTSIRVSLCNETIDDDMEGGESSLAHAPFGPEEFNSGLQVFFASPCTISLGIVLVS